MSHTHATMSHAHATRIFWCMLVVALFCAPALFGQQGSDAFVPFQQKDYQLAIQIVQRELLNNPNRVDSLIILGWSMLATGQNQNALDTALRTQALAPNDERVAAVIGEAHYQLGNYLDALPFLERYAALAPTGIAVGRVHAIMGEIFIQFSEYHHAVAALSAAVRFDSSVSLWWQRLGFAHEQLSEYPLAESAYRQALQLNNTAEIQQAIDRVAR